jgi:hypothetical protein
MFGRWEVIGGRFDIFWLRLCAVYCTYVCAFLYTPLFAMF